MYDLNEYYDTEVVEVGGDKYLVNGYSPDSSIRMYRHIEDVFEFERDSIQMLLEE